MGQNSYQNQQSQITAFEKVSYEQFEKDFKNNLSTNVKLNIRNVYDAIRLPKRITKKSAGYDFFAPVGISLLPGESVIIPTGIRVKCKDNEFLMVVPRSGHGSKYFNTIANTVGIIDADYYESDNEGHIFIKLRRPDNINVFKTENRKFAETKKYTDLAVNGQIEEAMNIDCGKAFAQGIFLRYGMVTSDTTTDGNTRNGGHGSTDIISQQQSIDKTTEVSTTTEQSKTN